MRHTFFMLLVRSAATIALAVVSVACDAPVPTTTQTPSVGGQDRSSPAVPALADVPIVDVTDGVLAMQVAIARGVSAGRNASVDSLREASPADEGATDGSGTGLRLVFVSNAHGELEDCGCPRHPLGGLARRATIWDGIDAEPGAAFHFDAGNALFRDAPQVGRDAPSVSQLERAGVIARALSAMDAHFLAVGPRDLTAGAAELQRLAQRARLPLLATNLQVAGSALGRVSVVAESEGVRVGFVSVLRSDSQSEGFWQQTGATALDDVSALTAEIASLRAASVDLVVLVDTAGGDGMERLLESLEVAGAAPDVIVMSGNGISTHEPRVLRGIPALESGNRGKQVAHLTLTLVPGQPVSFATEARAWAMILESVQNTSRVLGQSEERLARSRSRGGTDPVAQNVLQALRQQRAELPGLYAMLLEQRARAESGAGAAASRLETELVNVELEIEERADIRDMVAEVLGE